MPALLPPPSIRPLLRPQPTLPTVRPQYATFAGERQPPAPYNWPQFNARLGELCYLSVFPGDKRRDRCAQWLLEAGEPYFEKDLSEICGAQSDRWMISPSVAIGCHKKFRYGLSAGGIKVGVTVAHTTDAAMAWLMRHTRAIAGCEQEQLHARLAALCSHRLTVQHFLHSLVLGELVSHLDVLDLINHHGKLYAVTPFYRGHKAADLLRLPRAARSALCRRMLLSVAKNLRDLHRHQAVHFNVCLSNIFFALHEVVLGGFASAHFIGGPGLPSDRLPDHAPPEMIFGAPKYSERADIWGLGMTLMRLLCGETGFIVASHHPSETGLPPRTWEAYALWYVRQTHLRDHEPDRGSLMDAGDAEPPGAHYLAPFAAQLSRGYAAATDVDAELARFILENMLVPSPVGRQQGDNLVSMAAVLSRGAHPRDNDALDAALKLIGATSHFSEPTPARMNLIAPKWMAASQVI